MEFDSVLSELGGFGRYHRAVLLWTWLPCLGLALSGFSHSFLTLVPEHHCRPDPGLLPGAPGNLSQGELLTHSLPREGETWSRCLMYLYLPTSPSPSPNPNQQLPNRTMACIRGWQYQPVAGLHNNVVSQWNLVCNDYWKVPLEQVSYMIGWIVGYLTFGPVTDRLGRRTTFILSLVLAIMLGVGAALSFNFLMFIILQVFSGAALAGILLSVYVARLEMCDPPHRLMVTMIAGSFTVAGKLLLPGVTELCKDWRILQGAVTAPFLLLLIYWCVPAMFPESPRWLLATKQMEKCKQIIRSIAAGNGVNLEIGLYAPCNVLDEMDTMFETVTQPQWYTFYDMSNARIIWKNITILGFTTFIAGGIQHCFVENLAGYELGFYFSYFIVVGAEGVAYLFLYFTVNKCGRRGILLLTTIVTGLSSLLLLALMQYLHHSLVLALSILGLCSSFAVAVLSVFFASEVIPTVVRGAGLGLIMAAGCIGKATTPITDLHNKHGFFLHHVIFASFAVLSVLCVMLLPESKRKPLPESIKDGENQRRPPLFLPRKKDGVPLLPSKQHQDYNPENYSRLVTATKKILTRHKSSKSQNPENESVTEESVESVS